MITFKIKDIKSISLDFIGDTTAFVFQFNTEEAAYNACRKVKAFADAWNDNENMKEDDYGLYFPSYCKVVVKNPTTIVVSDYIGALTFNGENIVIK